MLHSDKVGHTHSVIVLVESVERWYDLGSEISRDVVKDQSVTLRGSQRFMDFPCIVACNNTSSNGSMSLEIMAPNSTLHSVGR